MFAVLACAGAGDAITLPDPGYPDYLSAVALADGHTVALPLDGAAGWQPDFEAL
jgi:aspartate/methionine/tyrosine aminotransferase